MEEMIDKQFNDLRVVSFSKKYHGYNFWICECICGNKKEIREDHLVNGDTHSCGCKKKKQIIKRNKENVKHGMRNTRLYKIWCGMKDRCNNYNYHNYQDYGGRGIKIYDEWNNNFKSFYNWAIANGYNDGLTIDRIDINGNYEPTNCRWETMKVQENNKRNNRIILYNGKEQTVTQWAEEIGMKRETLISRLNAGWDIEKALTMAVHQKK